MRGDGPRPPRLPSGCRCLGDRRSFFPSSSSMPPGGRGNCVPRRSSRSARASPGRRSAAAPCSRSRSGWPWPFELGFDAPTKGAIAAGALINGFPGMDAPAKPRAGWQAATAPLIGYCPPSRRPQQSDGSDSPSWALGLVGSPAGYCFAVSLRHGDRRPLGDPGDADRPGPVSRDRRRAAGAPTGRRSAPSPRWPGRWSSRLTSTRPPTEPEKAW